MLAILWILISYIIIILVIAYISSKKNKNLSDYMLAGRNLSAPVAALGAGASDMSGWLMLGLPGAVFVNGLNMIWMAIALSIGAYLNWLIVAKRLRIFTERANNAITIPTYLQNRFSSDNQHDSALKIVTAIAIIIFFSLYSVAGLISGAILIKSVFNLNYFSGLILIAIVIVTYTAIGGFLAVNLIDFFQGCLMFLALLLVPIVAMRYLSGQQIKIWSQISSLYPQHVNVFADMNIWVFISLFSWGLGYLGQPHILVRFMAIRDTQEVPKARRICMIWMVFALVGAISTGLIGRLYFSGSLEDPETVFLKLSQTLFPNWIAGILYAAVLSAIMSTVSSLLLMSSSTLVEDVYHSCICSRLRNSQKGYLWTSRLALVIITSVCILIAKNPNSKVLDSVAVAWSGLGASFGPTILASLYWKLMNRTAALWGISVGTIVVFSWYLLKTFYGGIFNHPYLLPGFELAPGFMLSLFTIYVIGTTASQKKSAANIQNQKIFQGL